MNCTDDPLLFGVLVVVLVISLAAFTNMSAIIYRDSKKDKES